MADKWQQDIRKIKIANLTDLEKEGLIGLL